MARYCIITHKIPLCGNNVSHANNKTKRVFLPNLQQCTIYSDTLQKSFQVRITTRGIKTLEFHGGLDQYILTTKNSKLSQPLVYLKKKIQKVVQCQSQAK